MSEIGATLRDDRRAAGMTQRELAERCGMRQSHISAIENGRRPISAELVERIRAAMRPLPSIRLRKHAADVRRVAREHGATRIRVFGSVARGEDRHDSDIDLLVRMGEGASLFDLAAMRSDIEVVVGAPVDVVSEGALLARDEHILGEARPI